MGWHETVIPKRHSNPADAPQYYIAQRTPDGDYVCLSDEDPRDDVRVWKQLTTARWAAKTPIQLGYRVDAIIQVSWRGWAAFSVSEEEEVRQALANCPDFGSW